MKNTLYFRTSRTFQGLLLFMVGVICVLRTLTLETGKSSETLKSTFSHCIKKKVELPKCKYCPYKPDRGARLEKHICHRMARTLTNEKEITQMRVMNKDSILYEELKDKPLNIIRKISDERNIIFPSLWPPLFLEKHER